MKILKCTLAILILFCLLDFSLAKPAISKPTKVEVANLVVKEIIVKGNRKIESDAILARIKTKKGDTIVQDKIREDVQSLFKTGYFYDVQVIKSGDKEVSLTYLVVEKPSIVEIEFKGNSEISSDDLRESVEIKNYEILNMNKIREAVEKIQKQYEEKGYFLARVSHVIEDIVPGETVRLNFNIEENDKVKVKKITFLGNRNINDTKLKSVMQTQEGGFFSFLSGSGAYKQEMFDRDTQMLRYLYFNEGYVQVKIDRPQVYVTPDKKGIFISIRVEEGEQYFVGEVDFAGDLLFPRQELFETTQIDESKIFVYEKLQNDLSQLQAKYGDLGYAFANIIPRTRIDEKERKVDITFEIDKGNKVYFGTINIIGNTKTRDKVIRRELKITEGELYNETRKRQSLSNIQRLGFFDTVNFNTSTPPDRPNILNIEILVKERNTGTIQLGAGYSSSTKLTFQGQVNQTNFLGKGQNLGAYVSASSMGSVFNFNFTEPYFLDTDWSVGFDVYMMRTNRGGEYEDRNNGGAVRFGHPLAEYLHGYVKYRYDKTELVPYKEEDLDTDMFPLKNAEGVTSSLTFTLAYDERNDRFSPSKGIYSSGSVEYAGLGGDLKYTVASASFQYFKKVFWDVVSRNNFSWATLVGEGGGEPPFTERFLLGGPYSLRGYRVGYVGLRKYSEKRKKSLMSGTPPMPEEDAKVRAQLPFGGTNKFYFASELEFPLIEEANIKGILFFDTGAAEDVIRDIDFKSDVGFGFRWFSPIGPLRFEWGFPLNRNPVFDDPVNFEFSIGSPF